MLEKVPAQVVRTRIYDGFVLKEYSSCDVKIYQNYCWIHTSGMQKC